MRKSVYLAILLVLVVLLGLIMPAIPAQAVVYSGAGTMADPYLVTNAEQLQGMRDDLSAHYKLANTIDLKGVDFKPIGRLNSPFKGSFVCDLNEDNTPKYVIKNLSQEIAATPYVSERKSKWEAGLLGCVDGATVYGIYVLDANVINNVQGDNQGAVVYGNYKPGMDDMSTGILIGEARNATISNCGTTGYVGGKPNGCGGLIGMAIGCIVDNCYSTATVYSLGKWNIGGLIGGTASCQLTACFATGDVTGAQATIGGLVGSFSGGSQATDCYSTGAVSGGREGMSSFLSWGTKSEGAVITNCLIVGSCEDGKFGGENDATITNSYVVAGKTGAIFGFTSADLETIKTRLSDGNWAWDGDMPVLVNIGVITEASAYQPGANSGNPDVTPPPVDDTNKNDAPEKVATMIEALPDPEMDGTITLEHKDAIKSAYSAYEALTVGQKDDFDAGLFAKLSKARTKVSMLMATEIFDRIAALPEPEALTPEHKEEILAVWEDYNFLDDILKSSFDTAVLEKLEKAYAYAQDPASNTTVTNVDAELTTWDWILVIGSGVIILLVLTFNITVGIYQIRRAKKEKTATGDEG